MSLAMVCNFRKCRKQLNNNAWVTSCSHAFCIGHGASEFRRNEIGAFTCPTCGTELKDKFDVIQIDLNPKETFKSIVLAGLKPDTIMDIAMRAMSFWSYQVEQETLYQENQAKYAREKVQILEELNSLEVQKLKAELQTTARRLSTLQNEYDKKKKQAEELTAALEESNRRIQKVNFQLDAQKRKSVNINNYGEGLRKKEQWMIADDVAVNEFTFRPPAAARKTTQPVSCSNSTLFDFSHTKRIPRKFNFKPVYNF